jgi:hypothetical protein
VRWSHFARTSGVGGPLSCEYMLLIISKEVHTFIRRFFPEAILEDT